MAAQRQPQRTVSVPDSRSILTRLAELARERQVLKALLRATRLQERFHSGDHEGAGQQPPETQAR